MTHRPFICVRDVMKTKFHLVDGLMTVSEALTLMRDERAKPLIIRKRSPRDEYGMVLLSDIAFAVLAKDRSPERVNLYEIMTKPVIQVSPDMDVRYCARLFERYQLTHAPVVEAGELIGMVSLPRMVLEGLVRPAASD
ncbi:MAG: CBS domain-containing protein [Pseudomonadota bacterium]|nr:CBS domain-containing protein [Pseudomonadota bacterium]